MKKKNQYRIVIFLFTFIFSFASAVSAGMTSENFCLSSSVVSSGGMAMSSASYQID